MGVKNHFCIPTLKVGGPLTPCFRVGVALAVFIKMVIDCFKTAALNDPVVYTVDIAMGLVG